MKFYTKTIIMANNHRVHTIIIIPSNNNVINVQRLFSGRGSETKRMGEGLVKCLGNANWEPQYPVYASESEAKTCTPYAVLQCTITVVLSLNFFTWKNMFVAY